MRLLAVSLVLVVSAAIVCAGAASAAALSRGYGQMKAGDVWYGNYKTGSERGYCGDPVAGGANLYAPTANGGTSYGSVVTTSGWNPKTTGVGALSATNVYRLAYVVARHGQTSSNTTAAYVSYAVRTFVVTPGGAKGSAVPYAGSSIKAGGSKLIEEAKKYAGPYTVAPKLLAAEDQQTATLSGYRPVAASGATMTGYAGTLTITGPAVFGANDATSLAAPSDGAAVTLRATGDGKVTVTATYAKLPSTRLHYRKPANDRYQRILVSGRTEPATGAASITVDVPDQPKITTTTSDQIAKPGAKLIDKLAVTDLAPNSTITVTSTLYGPFTQPPTEAATPPVDAPIAGTTKTTVTGDANGAATVVTKPVTIETSGYYVWFETTDATTDNTAWPGRFGQTSETTLVKWAPTVVTETSDQRAAAGTKLTDKLAVTGLPPHANATVTSTLYGPFTTRPAASDTVPDDAPKVATVTTPVTADEHGSATATTEPVVIDKRGYYVWHETIESTDVHDGWPGRFGQTSETTIIPWQPAVTTQTSDQQVTTGAKITDNLAVTGLQPGATVRVNTTLYGPFTTKPQPADVPPEDAPRIDTLTLDVTADDKGAATATTAPVTVSEPGYYVWHETIDATDEHDAWTAPFGIATETTHVVSPPPGSPPPPEVPHLPDTGADASSTMLAVTAALLTAGTALVAIGRRRRHVATVNERLSSTSEPTTPRWHE